MMMLSRIKSTIISHASKNSSAAIRLMNELCGDEEDVEKYQLTLSHISGFGEDDVRIQMQATVPGPPDTPYSGGAFTMNIFIDSTYPFSGPIVVCETKLWHPNVCIDSGLFRSALLTNGWAASNSIMKIIYHFMIVLQDMTAVEFYDPIVSDQFLNRFKLFEKTAAYWTATFACPDSTTARLAHPECESKVQALLTLALKDKNGNYISEQTCILVLSCNEWDFMKAAGKFLWAPARWERVFIEQAEKE